MKCDDHRAQLIHHAYGELGPSERGPLLRHLLAEGDPVDEL